MRVDNQPQAGGLHFDNQPKESASIQTANNQSSVSSFIIKNKTNLISVENEFSEYAALNLYERMILGELSAEGYKAAKASVDTNLDRLNRANATAIAENEKLSSEKTTNDNLFKAAESASDESSLTRPLVDLLISKVYVYPGDKVEIVWKVSGFGG